MTFIVNEEYEQPNPLEDKLNAGIAYLRGEFSTNQSITGINETIRLARIAQKNYGRWVEINFMKLGCSPKQAFDAINESKIGKNGYGVFIRELVKKRAALKKASKKPRRVMFNSQNKIREGVAYLEKEFEACCNDLEGLAKLLKLAQLARRGFSLRVQGEHNDGNVKEGDLYDALLGLYGPNGNGYSVFMGKVGERMMVLADASAARAEDWKY